MTSAARLEHDQALAAPLATAYETGKLPPLLPGL